MHRTASRDRSSQSSTFTSHYIGPVQHFNLPLTFLAPGQHEHWGREGAHPLWG